LNVFGYDFNLAERLRENKLFGLPQELLASKVVVW